jgi:hypothetical protein
MRQVILEPPFEVRIMSAGTRSRDTAPAARQSLCASEHVPCLEKDEFPHAATQSGDVLNQGALEIGDNAVSGGGRAVARCDFLGVAPYSDTDDGLYRSYLSPAYLQAQTALRDWMVDAGMSVSVDAAGNMIGRYDGERDGPP